MCQCGTHDLIIPNDKNHEKINSWLIRSDLVDFCCSPLDSLALFLNECRWHTAQGTSYRDVDVVNSAADERILFPTHEHKPPLALILVYRTVILSAPVITHSLFLSRCFKHFSTTNSIKFPCAKKCEIHFKREAEAAHTHTMGPMNVVELLEKRKPIS